MAGYFGSHAARRHDFGGKHRRGDDAFAEDCGGADAADTLIPQSAICGCGATAILVAGRLPRDWSVVDGEARCGDCLQGSNIVIDLSAVREILRRREAQPIGAVPAERPHHGCRVTHEIVCGFAALEFRAGTCVPEGRDEAVLFMLTAHGLDELIIHLSAIRGELVASQTPGAAAREGGFNGH